MMKPTVGRIVHYQSHGSPNGQHKSEPRAAIVTGVYRDPSDPNTGGTIGQMHADLCVLNPTGMYFDRATPFSETPKAGHWSWPPKV